MNQEVITPYSALQALLRLKESVNLGQLIPYGICTAFNPYDTDYGLKDYMNQAGIDWSNWEKFSGNNQYPVRIFQDTKNYTSDISPVTLYSLCPSRSYWDDSTEYGRNRRELLDWLIDQFQQVVDRIEASQLNHV